MNAAESLTPSHLSLVSKRPTLHDTRLHCRRNSNINPRAALLMEDIVDLSKNERGYCHASDRHFADAYGVDVRTIKRWMAELDQAGYIDRRGRGSARRITPSLRWNNPDTPDEKGTMIVPLERDSDRPFRAEKGTSHGKEKGTSQGSHYRDTITESVEVARAPARGEVDNDDGSDLSFIPEKDRQHLPAIRETIRLLDGDRNLEVLKARTYGRGLGMAPAQHRALKAIVDELGWYPAVAACTIGAMIGVPLAKIRTVADQWASKTLTNDHDFWASRTV